jgi:hypothetical protein
MDKKNYGRFCIQFNVADPRHLQVIELLEQQGRHKAQFIAESVLQAVAGSETQTAPPMNPAALKQTVEALVKAYLRKEQTQPFQTEKEAPSVATRLPGSVGIGSEQNTDFSDSDMLAAIQDSVLAFRRD